MRRRVAIKRWDRPSQRSWAGEFAAIMAVALLVLAGCRSEMYDQPRYEPFEPSEFFDDGTSARPLVAGTVPRDDPRSARRRCPEEVFYTGKSQGKLPKPFHSRLTARSSSAGRNASGSTARPATASWATAGA